MSELKFEIAAQDKEIALDRDYTVELFELPDRTGEGAEHYAAVRPAPAAWVAVSQLAYNAYTNDTDQYLRAISFLDQCLNADDLRRGLIEDKQGRWNPEDADQLQDPDLNDAGVQLAQSNLRLARRLIDNNDAFGLVTMADVMVKLVERWSGNPTGRPQDYLPPQRNTGRSSTGRRSSKALTSSRSSTSRRRASSQPSETDS